MCPQERRFGPSNRRDVMNEGISRRNFIGGAALGGVLLPVLGQWTVLVAAAEQAVVFVWMWIR